MLRGAIAVTDNRWYQILSELGDIDEVNFWRPGAQQPDVVEGTPWVFKLHAPENAIAGVGFFKYYTRLPIGTAWDWFEEKNGARSLHEMLERLARYRRGERVSIASEIGCVILSEVTFFGPSEWLEPPEDWRRSIVSVKYYDLTTGAGARLWREMTERLTLRRPKSLLMLELSKSAALGKPVLITPRLGQGGFRSQVADAYGRRCAITAERVFPALEAAHIKPFAEVHHHDVRNGLLVRSDLHRLLDKGYVTVEPDLRFTVSSRVRDEFHNGREYYALDGRKVAVPSNPQLAPATENLEWHSSHVFLGK